MGMGYSGGMGQQYQPQGQAGGMPQMQPWQQSPGMDGPQMGMPQWGQQQPWMQQPPQTQMYGQPGMFGQQQWGGMPPWMQQQPTQNGWGMNNFNPMQNQQIDSGTGQPSQYDMQKFQQMMQNQGQQWNNPTAPAPGQSQSQHTTPMPPPGRTTGYFGGDAFRNKLAQQQKQVKKPAPNPVSNPMNAAMGGFNRGFK